MIHNEAQNLFSWFLALKWKYEYKKKGAWRKISFHFLSWCLKKQRSLNKKWCSKKIWISLIKSPNIFTLYAAKVAKYYSCFIFRKKKCIVLFVLSSSTKFTEITLSYFDTRKENCHVFKVVLKKRHKNLKKKKQKLNVIFISIEKFIIQKKNNLLICTRTSIYSSKW